MMGRLNRDQGQLFYSFCLDEVVPEDHRVREIAAVLDLSWVPGIGPIISSAAMTVIQWSPAQTQRVGPDARYRFPPVDW